MNLFNLPRDEKEAITFLQERGVLPLQRVCKNGHEMTLNIGTQVRWRCRKKDCRTEVGIRVGNWMEGGRIPFVTVVRFVYCWSWEMTSQTFCERETSMGTPPRTGTTTCATSASTISQASRDVPSEERDASWRSTRACLRNARTMPDECSHRSGFLEGYAARRKSVS